MCECDKLSRSCVVHLYTASLRIPKRKECINEVTKQNSVSSSVNEYEIHMEGFCTQILYKSLLAIRGMFSNRDVLLIEKIAPDGLILDMEVILIFLFNRSKNGGIISTSLILKINEILACVCYNAVRIIQKNEKYYSSIVDCSFYY